MSQPYDWEAVIEEYPGQRRDEVRSWWLVFFGILFTLGMALL